MSPLRGATIGWGLYSAANGKYVLQKLIKVIEVGSYQDYRIFITLTTLATTQNCATSYSTQVVSKYMVYAES